MQTRRHLYGKMLVGVCGLALALAFPVGAQPAGYIPAKCGSVSEYRSSHRNNHNSDLWLQFESPAAAMLNCTMTRAVDDLGNELPPYSAADTMRRKPRLDVWRGRSSHPFSRTVSLRSPPREAKFIRLLEGEVELSDPTLENGGIIVITNFLTTAGTPLAHPALQEARVSLTRLTRSQYEERKVTLVQTNRSLFMQGGRDSLPPITVDAERDPKMYVILAAEDPEANVLGLLFEDAQGRALPVDGMRSSVGQATVFHFQEPLPAGLNLRVFLARPASRSKMKFKVENIALP